MTIWLTTYLHISGIFSYFLGLTAYISGIIEYFYIFVFLFDTSWSNASDFGSLGVTFVPIGQKTYRKYRKRLRHSSFISSRKNIEKYQRYTRLNRENKRKCQKYGDKRSTRWSKLMVQKRK